MNNVLKKQNEEDTIKSLNKLKNLSKEKDASLLFTSRQARLIQCEIERLNNIIESIKEEIEIYINVTIDHLETCNEEINFELRNKCRAMREIKDELLKIIDKELKEGDK